MSETPHSPDPSELGRTAWIDAGAGIAGDMLLGALLDAGASLDAVTDAVEAVLPATVALRVHEVRRAGMRATKVDVEPLVADQHHRRWVDIREMIERAHLPERVRRDAVAVFACLADAEARAHGISAEEVHFHEVGAWDSIADIVGCCAALASLGVGRLLAGEVSVGSGTVKAAHGEMSVPVPAVLELSRDWRIVGGGEGELTTPTGMALLAALATQTDALPSGTIVAVGVGAGTKDIPTRANVTRVVVCASSPVERTPLVGRAPLVERSAEGAKSWLAGGTTKPATKPPTPAVELQTNVDDLDPRLWPEVIAALLAAGASDAWLTPILMKKGRPAHTLHVLAKPELADALRHEIFRQVPTLGVREYAVDKHELDRTWREVTVDGETIRVKLGLVDGAVVTATPEFADVVAASDRLGRPVREVLADAIAADHGTPAPDSRHD